MENMQLHNDEKHDQDVSSREMELDMIRATLLLNPENFKLSPDELDSLVNQEYLDSKD